MTYSKLPQTQQPWSASTSEPLLKGMSSRESPRDATISRLEYRSRVADAELRRELLLLQRVAGQDKATTATVLANPRKIQAPAS